MGSHSYLVNLQTNIHDLHTSGLLNSHASATTTTNVGHMAGDRSSVINLGELQELDAFNNFHLTNAQADVMEKIGDWVDHKSDAAINADASLTDVEKAWGRKLHDDYDHRLHAWVESHRENFREAKLQNLTTLHCTKFGCGWL